MNRRSGMLAFAAALALTALAACSPEVPAAPTYTKDVAPILDAHCVRCHGAGGTLNMYPFRLATINQVPQKCYLQRYDDDCSAGPTACLSGAKTCASLIVNYVNYPAGNVYHMPPLPSDSLNDWEKDVLARWTATTPPAP